MDANMSLETRGEVMVKLRARAGAACAQDDGHSSHMAEINVPATMETPEKAEYVGPDCVMNAASRVMSESSNPSRKSEVKLTAIAEFLPEEGLLSFKTVPV